MGFKDLREWIAKLEAEGDLKRIKAKVDWNGELSEIAKRAINQREPALLFENIKDHENTRCTKVFAGGLARRSRVALMLGLPSSTSRQEVIKVVRERLKGSIKPTSVNTGPVKENIVKGKEINLFEFPVPKWHPLDGGRYINTYCGTVTRDPETGIANIGLYRGMIRDKDKIGGWLVPSQHWGLHYGKYKAMGKPMPVAFVYGWDEVLPLVAGTAIPYMQCEYDVMGSFRQEPVELVKCETSDLEVPASAEIVIEGTVSPDPSTYDIEGPFGEGTGFYGGAGKRPIIQVECITHRDDPIFRGQREGNEAGIAISESAVALGYVNPAVAWNTLDSQGVPGVLDVAMGHGMIIVKIHKAFEGQAQQVAAALWGSNQAMEGFKNVMVVEEDIDIYNLRALQFAVAHYVDPKEDLVIFPDSRISVLDVSVPEEKKEDLVYGGAVGSRVLIDATISWNRHPLRKEWNNNRYPPNCGRALPEDEELVQRRWKEYGF